MASHLSAQLEKQNLIEMAWLLTDLVVDLKTPTDIIELARDSSLTKIQVMSIIRITMCALVINLSKLLEVLKFYGKDIRSLSPTVSDNMNSIKRELENKKIYAYRSKYIAHAFIKERGAHPRPLSIKEASHALMKIIDKGLNPVTENAFSFCLWVYTKDEEKCVVKTIEQAVKEIEVRFNGLGQRP